ncbi:MAG: hypothetical protein AAGA48_27820 [Myxococcota bacterium]
MRVVVVPLMAWLAIGCAPAETEIRFRSTVITESDGVAMADDGLTTYAAMQGVTCALDVRWGCPTIEDDLPTENEQVLDHLDGTTIASSDATLHYMDGGTWDPSRDVAMPALRTARLSNAGLMVLNATQERCELDIGDATYEVDGALCTAEDYEVDRRGALVAVTSEGILRADANGVTKLADEGDRSAVDMARDYVYVATAGDTRLAAVDPSGAQAWSMDLENPILDVASRGDKGDVVVLTQTADGYGQIERRDGLTGETKAVRTVPSSEGELVVAANGRTLALVLPDEIHHYEIVVDGEDAPEGEPVTCPDIPAPASSGLGVSFD